MKNWMLVSLRKSILGIALLVSMFCGFAQAQTANTNAQKAFQSSSGGANATWAAGPNGSWEATWMKESQKMIYCYDATGVLQQKKIISQIASFPLPINKSIAAVYPQGTIQGAYKVVDRSNAKFYEVQVANGSSVDRMRYDLEGKPIGKTSMAAMQPAAVQPTLTASAATPAVGKPSTSVIKPAVQPAVAPATSPKPASPAVAVKPATPAPTAKPVTPTPAAKPVVVASTQNKPASQPIAMRGESATTNTKPATNTVQKDDLLDDDMGDLLDDDDLDNLLKDDENWDDINLDDPTDDDSDLLDPADSLDDDLNLDDDLDDDGL